MVKKRRKRKSIKKFIVPGLIALCLIFVACFSVWILRVSETEMVEGVRSEHTLDFANLNTDAEFWTYEDSEFITVTGIDVSEHQQIINWEKVKNAGVKFAMIRVGYRGTESGNCTEDNYFEENIQGALENGIQVGVYFFSQAITVEEAREEAWFVLDKIAEYEIDMPIAFDMEYPETGTNRIALLTANEKTKIANTYLSIVERNGYSAMVYGSSKTIGEHFELQYLTQYETWIADYDLYVKFPYDFLIWQYSETGHVDGIDGNVDLDMLFTKKSL